MGSIGPMSSSDSGADARAVAETSGEGARSSNTATAAMKTVAATIHNVALEEHRRSKALNFDWIFGFIPLLNSQILEMKTTGPGHPARLYNQMIAAGSPLHWYGTYE
jgi:hypothetical protein